MKKFLFIACIFLSVSCERESHTNAALAVANIMDAQDYSLGSENDGKTIVLTLENFNKIQEKYIRESVPCLAAVKFIENLPEAEYEGVDKVKVIAKHKDIVAEKEFSVTEIKTALQYFKASVGFFKALKDENYENFDAYFDTTKLGRADISRIKLTMHQRDSTVGKPEQILPYSYEFKASNEGGAPLILVHTDISNKRDFADFLLVFKTSDGKIIYISANEKPKP